jgi:N6-adenosine-specific RNA methylase IME4
MASELSRYDAARSALAAASRIDEVKDIRDKAAAMQEYARQAKDKDLIGWATEMRKRAERRLGEMMEVDRKAGRLQGGRPKRDSQNPVLSDQGIDKNLALRARKAAAIPEESFEEAVAKSVKAAISGMDKLSTDDKQAARAVKEAALGAKQEALPDKKYGVILADPPWRFEPYSRDTGMDRAADNHYPTLETHSVAYPGGLHAISIAADDCILFLWATAPMLIHALQVMEAWGFDYKSQFVWIKDRIGTGYWNRNKHELLLIGARGNIPAPAMGTQWPSAVEAPVGEHSAKPEKFLEMIEAYFPTLPKIELNRRGPARQGWDAWGNELQVAEGREL